MDFHNTRYRNFLESFTFLLNILLPLSPTTNKWRRKVKTVKHLGFKDYQKRFSFSEIVIPKSSYFFLPLNYVITVDMYTFYLL